MTMLSRSTPALPRAHDPRVWTPGGGSVCLVWGDDEPVQVAAYRLNDREIAVHRVPAVEIITAASGHLPASARLAHSALGTRLRYVDHEAMSAGGTHTLRIRQRAGDIEAVLELEAADHVAALRTSVEITNIGETPIVLMSVSSWCAGFTDLGAEDPLAGWRLLSGRSDWLGEGRWNIQAMRGPDFPPLAEHLTGHNPRGSHSVTSQGTWSTASALPTGAVAGEHLALAWQIEHNGAWRWEIGEDTSGGYLALSGPTDLDAAWTRVLAPGESFRSVPVTVAFGSDLDAGIAALTAHRRASRRPHPDNAAMPVVFNDYMNTLDGDPTTDKLLPLVAAAAEIGAEVFCVDAGWYDDSGHWWDTVGEWRPSATRFPGGLGEVVEAIRNAGMVPGLWLEPEVIGVRSPMAARLPAAAFLQRHGQPIVEHDRYHLDLRHPAARAHLDEVVDRLVRDFGVGFFKFDYNINPGAGTDLDADSVGDGLLQHNRAHLAWLDGVLDRHPGLVIENCSSGAMRMDYAMLSRLAMQSTSDQQDYLKYPPIAASAPLSMLPEQAANWAYPQPEMSDEQISFCLVSGLLGRFYLSGYLNRMSPAQRDRVAAAVGVAKELRGDIRSGLPHWPLGLPQWTDEWVALGLRTENGDADVVSIWHREGSTRRVVLSLPHLRGREVTVTTLFPLDLPVWRTGWDARAGMLTVNAADDTVAARTLRLTAADPGGVEASHHPH